MTENHNYDTPEQGSTDWHVPLNTNFEQIDTDVEIRDKEANLGDYTPKEGAKLLAIDTGNIFLANGSEWNQIPAPTSSSNPTFEQVVTSEYHHAPETTARRENIVGRNLTTTDHVELYVDPNAGSDDNKGDESAPLASFQEALHRLPFILQHSVRIYLANGDYTADSNTIHSNIHYINFMKGMNGYDSPFKIIGNTSDPSQVRLSNTGYVNLCFKGQVPYRTVIEGIQFEGLVQNYNGAFTVRNCRFNGNVVGVHAFDGYTGFSILEDCWFGGNVDRAIYANHGHRIYVRNCTGDVNEVYQTRAMGEVDYDRDDNSISGTIL